MTQFPRLLLQKKRVRENCGNEPAKAAVYRNPSQDDDRGSREKTAHLDQKQLRQLMSNKVQQGEPIIQWKVKYFSGRQGDHDE